MPVKIILPNVIDIGYEEIEDISYFVEMDLNQQSTIWSLKEEIRSKLDMNITEKDQIYWKPSPTENFVKIMNDKSLQLALRVGEHIRDFFLIFKVQKNQI